MNVSEVQLRAMTEAIVEELLAPLPEVSTLEVAEMLQEFSYLKALDPAEWDSVIEAVRDSVEEELEGIQNAWLMGVI